MIKYFLLTLLFVVALNAQAKTCKEIVSIQQDEHAVSANEMIGNITVIEDNVSPNAIEQVTSYLNTLSPSELSALGKYTRLHASTSTNYNVSGSTPTLILSDKFLTTGGVLIIGASTNFQIDEILSGRLIQKIELIVANHVEGEAPRRVESLFQSLTD